MASITRLQYAASSMASSLNDVTLIIIVLISSFLNDVLLDVSRPEDAVKLSISTPSCLSGTKKTHATSSWSFLQGDIRRFRAYG